MIGRIQMIKCICKYTVSQNLYVSFHENIVDPFSLFKRNTSVVMESPFRHISNLPLHGYGSHGADRFICQYFYRIIIRSRIKVACNNNR